MNQNSMNKSDDNDCISVLSANEIESAMTAVSSFSVNNNNNSSVLQRKLRKHSSTLEPIKDLSNEITNSTDCMHQLENLSLLNEQNNQDSLVSFEHHELTQCTPMSSQLKAQTNSTPMSSRLNDLNESNDMRNYFNNLASSLIASNMEEDMVSSYNLKSIDYVCCLAQEKSCYYCSKFYSARESESDKYQSYFIDLNGNKISNKNFNLNELYKKRLTNKNFLSLIKKSIKLKGNHYIIIKLFFKWIFFIFRRY